MQYLFVTGLHRSGTTLLEKLLHNHPQVAMTSQPAPFLYYHAKLAFLAHASLQRLYPINPQFPEAGYEPKDFQDFLKSYLLNKEELIEIFGKMEGYEAQYSQELLAAAKSLEGGNFADIYRQVCGLTKLQSPKKPVLWQGTKEIIGEEFVPYLSDSGIKNLLIIRDPRDMLLSTNAGKELGQTRPTLYYLRMWRKSVAYALELQQKNQALVLRYEDLVLQPELTLNRISGYLGLTAFPDNMLQRPILGQSGTNWSGNSAFDRLNKVSSSPVGRYRQHFSASQVRFIEAYCFPEMQIMGYTCEEINKENHTSELLGQLLEPFAVTHRNFSASYSHSTENIKPEIERINLLTATTLANSVVQKEFFIFETAYQKLRQALFCCSPERQ